MYLIFEGIDTSGKTTQIELLKSNFPEILTTKEPAGTEFGRWAREILLNGKLESKRAETLLFLADRAEHYQRVVAPNRDSKLVVSDRGFLSGIAYALANGDEEFDKLLALNSYALSGRFPDLVVMFEIDEETLKSRLSQKSQDSIEKRGIEYMLRVQEELKNSLKKISIPYKIIDSRESLDEVYKKVSEILKLK